MTTEKVNDLELVKLSDYFTPGKFRTIPGTAMTDRGGITEMQAVFNIKYRLCKAFDLSVFYHVSDLWIWHIE